MGNITVGRYSDPAAVGYLGWPEPEDKTWIMFIDRHNTPAVFLSRNETGAVI